MRFFRIGLAIAAGSLIVGREPWAQRTLGPSWTVDGNQFQAGFGSSVSSAGDVDHDGYDDVIVAAFLYDGGQVNEGRAYVYHGSKYGLAKVPAWTAETDQAEAGISSVAAAGDVNGDGYGDVIVGSGGYFDGEYAEGIVLVYHGSPAGLGSDPAWIAEGNEPSAGFGSLVAAAGDVNGDGYGDVLVRARFSDIHHVPQGEGKVFLYLGSPSGLSTSPAWSARGHQAFAEFGAALAAGDVDGDGYDDVIVGAYAAHDLGEPSEGRAYVYLGSPSGPSTTPAWTAEGDQDFAYFGSCVGAADVNGDGYDDVIVGAPGFISFRFGLSPDGRVTVYLGSPAGVSPKPAWAMTGDQRAGGFASTLVSGADLDGDGFGDVIVGAPTHRNGQRDEGRVVAFFGSASGPGTRSAWSAEGDQARAFFGSALASAGDVNGDGIGDLIVGAYAFDSGQSNEGRAFGYLGSSLRRLR